ncbi:MAG: Gfo/Idh/MocA family oxidoreductase [Bacteroidota bacterium]
MKKYFALTGIAGYIAPRHLQAIKETGNELIAAMDPHDSVGILDRYFTDVSFFSEFERFDRHLERIKRDGSRNAIDYLSICSPNYLHDAHMRLALRLGADAICEKPLVANPWQLDALEQLEAESPGKIYPILQLRVHDQILALREALEKEKKDEKYEIDLTYMTSRGAWYLYSWKGDVDKSGGIATNIGIHFFDLLIWLFGKVQDFKVYLSEPKKMSGSIELEGANVKWYLSIDRHDLPQEAVDAGKPTYRSLTYDGKEIEFSTGFTDLHTRMYQTILAGESFGLEAARPAIELVHRIRQAKLSPIDDGAHWKLHQKS